MKALLNSGLARYIAGRLGLAAVTLFCLASLTFVVMRAVPGDPLTRTKEIPAAVRQNLETKYGLNRPLYIQYGIDPSARGAYGNDAYQSPNKKGGAMRRAFDKFFKK